MEPITENTDAGGETGAENWKERIARLEAERDEAIREKKGIYRDLKEKERQLSEARSTVSSTRQDVSSEDPGVFVTDINNRGRQAVLDAVKPVIQTILNQDAQREQQRSKERALRWLARQESKRTGKVLDEEDIEEKILPDILETARENNLLSTMDWENGAKAAYKILESERQKKKTERSEEDREREETISRTSGEASHGFNVREVDISNADIITRDQAVRMLSRINIGNPSEADKKVMADLKIAEQEGRIRIK